VYRRPYYENPTARGNAKEEKTMIL
jgi:hypothetical protein